MANVNGQTLKSDSARDLQTLVTLTGSKATVKEFIKDFVLITYDIPQAEAKARTEFLHSARKWGIVQHTESVYYAPRSAWTDNLVLELGTVGKVFAWMTTVNDEDAAKYLTATYDTQVLRWLDDLHKRLIQIDEHIEDGKLKLADGMLERTIPMLNDMTGVLDRRGSGALQAGMANLRRVMGEVASHLIIAMGEKIEQR